MARQCGCPFSVLLRALKEIFFEAARSGQYLYDRDAAARLAQATGLSSTRTTSAVRVVLAAVQSWQQHSPRLQRTRVLRRGTTQEGAEYSVVDPFISEFSTGWSRALLFCTAARPAAICR